KTGAIAGTKSIAVLPFLTIGGASERDLVVARLEQGVMAELARAPGLTAVACSADELMTHDLRQVAGRLGVAAFFEGSVRHEGSRVRVAIRLVDPATGQNLWAETFDRDVAGLATVPAEIANGTVAVLERRSGSGN